MIQAADAFVKNDHISTILHFISYYRQAMAMQHELAIHLLMQDQQRFLSFALCLHTKI